MDPIEVSPNRLLFGKKGHQGLGGRHPHRLPGHPGLRGDDGRAPHDRKFPLAKAAEGYARMMSGRAEFRVVLYDVTAGRRSVSATSRKGIAGKKI